MNVSSAPTDTGRSTSTAARNSGAALLSACLGGLFDGFDASIYVLVLFPALSDLLNTKSHEVVAPVGALLLAVFMIGWAMGAIIFGRLSDRFGRVKIMTWTILLYALSSGLCALSHSWQELAFYRFLVGLGIGGEMGTGAIFLSEWFSGKTRYRALAVMNGSICAGYMLSAVANFVLGHAGWRYVFLCGLAPALLAIYVRLQLKDPARTETEIEEQRNFSPFKFLFSLHLKKSLIVLTLASVAMVNWWAVLSWVPAWINQMTGGLAVTERSAVSFTMYMGSIIFDLLGMALLVYLRRRRTFAIAFAGCLIFDLLMFLTVKSYGPALLAFAFGAGGFAAMPFMFLYTMVPELYPTKVRGTAFGISIQTGRTFAALFALIGGQLIAAFHGSYPIAGSVVALVNVLGFAAAWLIPEDENYLSLESSWEKATAPEAEGVGA
jgi:MFS family permease